MDDDLERRFERLGTRGHTRGAGAVWEGARSNADAPARQRSMALGAAAVLLAGATLVGVVAITTDDSPESPAATSPPTTGAPVVIIAQNASSLVRFDDCAAVLDELQEQALERVGPFGLGTDSYVFFASGPGYYQGAILGGGDGTPRRSLQPGLAPDGSETNNQEAGVDEPDLVETDGRRVYDVRGGTLHVTDVESAALTATVPLGLVNVDGAVLVDDVLVVLANEPLSTAPGGEAKVVLVDVAATPLVRERLTIDGYLVDARVVGGRVHVVTTSSPSIAFTYPTSGGEAAQAAATAANKERVRSSTLTDWLPSRSVSDADGAILEDHAQLTDCDAIRRPKVFAGFEQTSLVTLDLTDLAASRSTSVQATSLLVYGSADSLYTATTAYQDPANNAGGRPAGYEQHTDVHRFTLGADPTYEGSGRVEGVVREQFGLSEHDGHLRVASSTFAGEGGPSSRVTVLRLDEGELVETGVVDGLGPSEDIEGVRFVGDLGYVVTFRRTDPLYVLDLRDPRAPRLAGQLKVPGYSRYLHPLGDGLVLGVGFDGNEAGQLKGAAASLFDVSDPAAPTRLDLEAFGTLTEPKIEVDHHAFTWWEETHTAYIPVGVFGAGSRVEVVHLEGRTLEPVGEVLPAGDGAPAQVEFDRVVIAGDRLLSISPDGVQVSDLATLAPIAWVSYG